MTNRDNDNLKRAATPGVIMRTAGAASASSREAGQPIQLNCFRPRRTARNRPEEPAILIMIGEAMTSRGDHAGVANPCRQPKRRSVLIRALIRAIRVETISLHRAQPSRREEHRPLKTHRTSPKKFSRTAISLARTTNSPVHEKLPITPPSMAMPQRRAPKSVSGNRNSRANR
jgi:hypothetical protein